MNGSLFLPLLITLLVASVSAVSVINSRVPSAGDEYTIAVTYRNTLNATGNATWWLNGTTWAAPPSTGIFAYFSGLALTNSFSGYANVTVQWVTSDKDTFWIEAYVAPSVMGTSWYSPTGAQYCGDGTFAAIAEKNFTRHVIAVHLALGLEGTGVWDHFC